jgi:hypothetical protein
MAKEDARLNPRKFGAFVCNLIQDFVHVTLSG